MIDSWKPNDLQIRSLTGLPNFYPSREKWDEFRNYIQESN